MRNLWYTLAAAAVVAVAALPAAAVGSYAPGDHGEAKGLAKAHNLKHPLGKEQAALRAKGLQMKLDGKIAKNAKVAQVAKGQYVRLEQTGNERVFVVLAEFGDEQHPTLGTGGGDGPLHNQIEQPNRANDNSTIWQNDFDVAHYEDMYFNKMDAYYKSQSSGRYGVNGDVMEWVKVPFNEARYGSNLYGDSIVWALIRDSINVWTAEQLAQGKSAAAIKAYLDTFDEIDRYDYDNDGNFAEQDGYIDHFQIVHAGVGEETGGGAQGDDAIWSHRWYAYYTNEGVTGPSWNKLGGTEFGGGGPDGSLNPPATPVGVWVGDYTIQPENGGLGVFAHEFGHDLGLPDHYDKGNAENSSAFWNLMSSGSYLGDGSLNGIGTDPGDMSAWDKFALGWLNYDVASYGQRSAHRLGPAETNTKGAQGLFVVLPSSMNPMTTAIGTPQSGGKAFWSGMGASLDHRMTRDLAVPAGGPITLSMKAWYEIETCWDYAYLRVSTDGGANYTNLVTNMSDGGLPPAAAGTATNENGQNFGAGITGISGAQKHCDEASGTPSWVTLTADLTPYAGQTVKLQLRYWTDPYVEARGFEVDDIAINGTVVDSADATTGWTLAPAGGFRITTGTETKFAPHYYLAEFRQYRGYDRNLRTGPYHFLTATSDWAQHFPYQDGLLVSYWDTHFGEDNNVSSHPGEGFYLPIDSHPAPLIAADNNQPQRTRIQVYDAPFGLEPTDAIRLERDGVVSNHPSLPAVPVFNDLNDFWFASKPDAGVKVPKTGTSIEVVQTNTQDSFMQVVVRPSK